MPPTPNAALGEPSPSSSRIDALDALRGLAVLGIFVINILGFAMPEIAFENPKAAGGAGAVNHGLWTFTTIFIEGSMRGLFSLMFGAGVMLFTARAVYPDGPIKIADLFYRRTMWLIVFGVIHAYLLLMPGDILLIYGLAGLVLFPFRILPPRKLVFLSSALLALFVADSASLEFQELQLARDAAAIETKTEAGERATRAERQILKDWQAAVKDNWPEPEDLQEQVSLRTGDAATVFLSNAEIVSGDNSTDSLLWWGADALMMMFLGMAFYQWRIITAERSLKFYALLAACGYAIGLAIRIWGVSERWAADFSPIVTYPWLFDQPGRIAMTIGHIGLFFTLWKFVKTSLPMRALTAAGRMALTNYIAQTVIANLIFSGIGLGFYGAVDRMQVYCVLVLIWLLQLAFSMWWLSRYRFGPLEWGWRALTYGHRPPLRK